MRRECFRDSHDTPRISDPKQLRLSVIRHDRPPDAGIEAAAAAAARTWSVRKRPRQ